VFDGEHGVEFNYRLLLGTGEYFPKTRYGLINPVPIEYNAIKLHIMVLELCQERFESFLQFCGT
jgi:hypothetical protein